MDLPIIPTSVEDINELFGEWYEHIRTRHITKLSNGDNPTDFHKDLWDARQIPALIRELRRCLPSGVSDCCTIIAEYLDRSKWVDIAFFSVPLCSIVDVRADETSYTWNGFLQQIGVGTRNQLRREFIFFGRTDGGKFELEATTDTTSSKSEVSGHFPLLFSDYNLRETTINIHGSLGYRYLIGLLPQTYSFANKTLLFPKLEGKLFTWSKTYGSRMYHWSRKPGRDELPKGKYHLFSVQGQELFSINNEYIRDLFESDEYDRVE